MALCLMDSGSPTIKLIKRLYYLLLGTGNSLRTLYLIYRLDFALK